MVFLSLDHNSPKIRKKILFLSGAHELIAVFGINFGFRGHRFGDPYITADDTPPANYGLSPQNGGPGIDGNIVFYNRMPPFIGLLLLYRKGAQGDALIQFDIPADYGGFPDNHPRTVVDKKGLPDIRAGMYVYTGTAMDDFAHNPGNQGHPPVPKEMGQAVNRNSLESRIGEDYLFGTFGCRVSPKGGRHIQGKEASDVGQFIKKIMDNKLRRGVAPFMAAGISPVFGGTPVPGDEGYAFFHLPDKLPGDMIYLFGGNKLQIITILVPIFPKTGKNEFIQPAKDIFYACPAGKIITAGMIYQPVRTVGSYQGFYTFM
jgi:catechol 2,3-dioxygenase-like lactoylglutathione lyase family enzyme